ncbi:MAG: hypothetical protein ABTQ73_08415, partial [Caldilineales bacterium]
MTIILEVQKTSMGLNGYIVPACARFANRTSSDRQLRGRSTRQPSKTIPCDMITNIRPSQPEPLCA